MDDTWVASSEGTLSFDKSDKIAIMEKTGEVAWPDLLILGTKYTLAQEVSPEACVNIGIPKERVFPFSSRLGVLIFLLFLFFITLSSIMFAFIWVAVTTRYLVISPYLMLFCCLGSLGLALTIWRGMRRSMF
jgi:hypothetical protein